MHDLRTTFAERWLKLQIEIGPPPGQPGTQRPASRGVTGPAGGLPGGTRRQTPMVASKAAADGLVTSGEPPPPSVQRGAAGGGGGGGGAGIAAKTEGRGGRHQPRPPGRGEKVKESFRAGPVHGLEGR